MTTESSRTDPIPKPEDIAKKALQDVLKNLRDTQLVNLAGDAAKPVEALFWKTLGDYLVERATTHPNTDVWDDEKLVMLKNFIFNTYLTRVSVDVRTTHNLPAGPTRLMLAAEITAAARRVMKKTAVIDRCRTMIDQYNAKLPPAVIGTPICDPLKLME